MDKRPNHTLDTRSKPNIYSRMHINQIRSDKMKVKELHQILEGLIYEGKDNYDIRIIDSTESGGGNIILEDVGYYIVHDSDEEDVTPYLLLLDGGWEKEDEEGGVS